MIALFSDQICVRVGVIVGLEAQIAFEPGDSGDVGSHITFDPDGRVRQQA